MEVVGLFQGKGRHTFSAETISHRWSLHFGNEAWKSLLTQQLPVKGAHGCPREEVNNGHGVTRKGLDSHSKIAVLVPAPFFQAGTFGMGPAL